MKLIDPSDVSNKIQKEYCQTCWQKRCYDCRVAIIRAMIRNSPAVDISPEELKDLLSRRTRSVEQESEP